LRPARADDGWRGVAAPVAVELRGVNSDLLVALAGGPVTGRHRCCPPQAGAGLLQLRQSAWGGRAWSGLAAPPPSATVVGWSHHGSGARDWPKLLVVPWWCLGGVRAPCWRCCGGGGCWLPPCPRVSDGSSAVGRKSSSVMVGMMVVLLGCRSPC
jgi:hypothetical protein